MRGGYNSWWQWREEEEGGIRVGREEGKGEAARKIEAAAREEWLYHGEDGEVWSEGTAEREKRKGSPALKERRGLLRFNGKRKKETRRNDEEVKGKKKRKRREISGVRGKGR